MSIKLNLNKNSSLTAHEPIGTEISIKNSKHSLKGENILYKNNFNTQKIFTTAAYVALGLLSFHAFGDGAADVDKIAKLGDTAKELLKGNGALVIDAIIIGASGFGAATLRSPAPIIFGLISVGLFHVAVKWITA